MATTSKTNVGAFGNLVALFSDKSLPVLNVSATMLADYSFHHTAGEKAWTRSEKQDFMLAAARVVKASWSEKFAFVPSNAYACDVTYPLGSSGADQTAMADLIAYPHALILPLALLGKVRNFPPDLAKRLKKPGRDGIKVWKVEVHRTVPGDGRSFCDGPNDHMVLREDDVEMSKFDSSDVSLPLECPEGTSCATADLTLTASSKPTRYFTISHEFGHALGLGHPACDDNDDHCYGHIAADSGHNIMGFGDEVSMADVRPFRELLRLFVDVPWKTVRPSFIQSSDPHHSCAAVLASGAASPAGPTPTVGSTAP